MEKGEIASFFAGRTLLITGATGFLGKVLIEKILRQLPQVRRVFLLIRPHPGADPEKSIRLRVEREILSSGVFNELRARHDERFEAFVRCKVEGVAGDISQPDLGLADEVLHRLASEVDLVVNIAALVSFDERLDHAVTSNTLGPQHLLDFAKRCRNPVVLHVSTAYVSGRRNGRVPEEALEPDRSVFDLVGTPTDEPFRLERQIDDAMRLARAAESESRIPAAQSEFLHAALAQLPPGLHSHSGRLHKAAEKHRRRWVRKRIVEEGQSRARRFGWLDVYTFSKAMGEQMLVKCGDGVATVILRPSIIESSFAEPEPGWIEGFRMSDPILFGYGKGRVLDFPGKRDSVIDFIPVDFVASAILASLPTAGNGNNPKVFHVATSSENPLRLGDLMKYCLEYFRRSPMQDPSGQPIVPQPWKYRRQEEFYAWLDRRRQTLRAALALCGHMDSLPVATRLRRALKARQVHLERLDDYSRLYGDYARLSCCFATDNTRQLFQSLPAEEQRSFFFDPTAIEWRQYLRDVHLPGVKRHVMKRA